ncbi:MAG: Asp-tRNA(Asn)/Glu-tRNA(Gln) amidotransferase subunit GatC [Oscillospiraceae bacterium]
MAVDINTIKHLCNLSKLDYSEDGVAKVMGEMSDIIDLMDEIKEFDLTYDDTKDGNEIRFSDTREDIAEESFPTEKLLANAENQDGCYVVPKVVE